jgi:hypothetical protein
VAASKARKKATNVNQQQLLDANTQLTRCCRAKDVGGEADACCDLGIVYRRLGQFDKLWSSTRNTWLSSVSLAFWLGRVMRMETSETLTTASGSSTRNIRSFDQKALDQNRAQGRQGVILI